MNYDETQWVTKGVWRSTCISPSCRARGGSNKIVSDEIVMFYNLNPAKPGQAF